MISSFYFGDETLGNKSSIKSGENAIDIGYPCSSSTKCTYISFSLNHGKYKFELFGANGGIRSSLYKPGIQNIDSPGSGGYVSALINLSKSTRFYAFLGGKGHSYSDGLVHDESFNGGGAAEGNYPGTGGGATDIRVEKSDPFHRILVAGGGGGSDDFPSSLEANDGKGGAGGGLVSQSFFVSSKEINGYESTQEKGYSFFQGEAGKKAATSSPTGYKASNTCDELAGGGGGWFGGYSSHHNNGGAAGGSSFALTSNATIPSGVINIYDKDYNVVSSGFYAFSTFTSPYIFYNVEHKRGYWNGDGRVVITKIGEFRLSNYYCTRSYKQGAFNFRITLLILIAK